MNFHLHDSESGFFVEKYARTKMRRHKGLRIRKYIYKY